MCGIMGVMGTDGERESKVFILGAGSLPVIDQPFIGAPMKSSSGTNCWHF